MPNIDKDKFKVGDRIRYTCERTYLPIYGKVGTIISTHNGGAGVQFDEYVGGHNCDGIGKLGYCYKLDVNNLEKIEDLLVDLI